MSTAAATAQFELFGRIRWEMKSSCSNLAADFLSVDWFAANGSYSTCS